VLNIRLMTPADIPLGLTLCRLAGWNQTEADWQRLLTLSRHSVFVAEYKAHACATACATSYGTKAAWIGMVLVHPDFRRRDIGSSLMRYCLDWLRAKGVESIKIDASDQGRPVYLRLGFDDERPVHRYVGVKASGLDPYPDVSPISADLWPAIAQCDQAAFGADRLPLLKLLATEATAAAAVSATEVKGYGFARRGFHASYIGPVIAVDAPTAHRIVVTLLCGLPEGEVYWDILPDNVAAKRLAAQQGFTLRRRFTRMCVGSSSHPGNLNLIFGTAGLELG
jgi:GNAT superfamily N-acetyltransferase